MQTFLAVVVLIGGALLYYEAKKRLKQKVFQKGQYAEQRELTEKNLHFTTTASVAQVQEALNAQLPTDDSVKGAFLGGTYSCKQENEHKVVYQRSAKLTTGGQGDEFTGSVNFFPQADGTLRAIASIDKWRTNDGVTRRAGIDAMSGFMNSVHTAFRNADPKVLVEQKAA